MGFVILIFDCVDDLEVMMFMWFMDFMVIDFMIYYWKLRNLWMRIRKSLLFWILIIFII